MANQFERFAFLDFLADLTATRQPQGIGFIFVHVVDKAHRIFACVDTAKRAAFDFLRIWPTD
jgi:hypothetical protein